MKNDLTVNRKKKLMTVMTRSDLVFKKKLRVFLFPEHSIKLDKNLNLYSLSGADRYKLFCGTMFVPALILTLLDRGGRGEEGRFCHFHVSLLIIVSCISQFQALPPPGNPWANFLVKSQGAGYPWDPLF